MIQTFITLNGKHIDTTHYEQFNPDQKALVTRFYRDNKVRSIATVELDAKGQTVVMKFDNIGSFPDRTEYFYDKHGSVIETVHRQYMRYKGFLKEAGADTTRLTYDSRKNKLTSESRSSLLVNEYDAKDHLIRHDFYMNKNGKYQRDVYRYKEERLVEMLGYWFDGKLYKHLVNQYDAAGHLVNSADSTTNWLQIVNNTYDEKGLLVTKTDDKTFQNVHSTTTTNFTYTPQEKVATRTINSNDPMLGEIYLLKTYVHEARLPPYDLKETYDYDKYGNRLKITTELAGKTVKIEDFIMTYYP